MSAGTPDTARASVDHDLCVGHGGCRRIAPAAFRRTAVGQSEFAQDHAESTARIVEAAQNCPVAAITVQTSDTGERLYPQSSQSTSAAPASRSNPA
jgi:ferredoxin